ncbi:MAG TPA: hypothetical protein GXX14_05660 [Clostridiaceae bacterium]|nr:hypothetical protein [Clostridiaceae bacterium]
MLDYHSDEQLTAVGQSCRHYESLGFVGNRYGAGEGSISCRTCKNWNGSTCVRQAFDSVLSNIERS